MSGKSDATRGRYLEPYIGYCDNCTLYTWVVDYMGDVLCDKCAGHTDQDKVCWQCGSKPWGSDMDGNLWCKKCASLIPED